MSRLAELTIENKREIERLKNTVIKPRWASDIGAQKKTAIDVIATYGIPAIPTLLEISQRVSGLTRVHALDCITRLYNQIAIKGEHNWVTFQNAHH